MPTRTALLEKKIELNEKSTILTYFTLLFPVMYFDLILHYNKIHAYKGVTNVQDC